MVSVSQNFSDHSTGPGSGQSSDLCSRPTCQPPSLPPAPPGLPVPLPPPAALGEEGRRRRRRRPGPPTDCQAHPAAPGRASPARPGGGAAALRTPTGPAPSGDSFPGGRLPPDLPPPTPLGVGARKLRAAGLSPVRPVGGGSTAQASPRAGTSGFISNPSLWSLQFLQTIQSVRL